MPRGPKPKPAMLRVLEGGRRARDTSNEPVCALPPEKPPVVERDATASAEWDRLLAAMPPGLYNALDVAVLSSYALAWAMLTRAQEAMDKQGLLIELPVRARDTGNVVGTRVQVNPALRVHRAASEALIKAADRLGLAPTVRTRLSVPVRKDAGANSKFNGLLGQRPDAS